VPLSAPTEDRSTQKPVFADERQQKIAEYVTRRGRARISELAERFSVTEQTVRKDLRALSDGGLVNRTHGGAIALHPLVERDLAGREATNPEAKQRLAHTCLGLIRDGDSVFLDSGTTVAYLARALAAAQKSPGSRPRNLTVLTSALDVAQRIADLPSIDHVLLGGQLRTQSGALVGALTIENLQRFTVNIAFMGVSGFSREGLSVAGIAEAQVKAALIERARHVVVPLEASKAGATDFARICGLDAVDTAVIDEPVVEIQELCAANQIRLVVAQAS
jgi:DeoR/GlpR family transcriptional regulator of sugar metabolism